MEEKVAREKLELEKLEAFKNKNRIKLDFMHGFGIYTGEPDEEIFGQIQLLRDTTGTFRYINQGSEE